MNERVKDIIIGIFIFLILVAATAFVIDTLLIEKYDINENLVGSILSGILSLIGGAIGALGAYYVAILHVKKDKKHTRKQMITNELPIYIGLSIELEKIVKQLEIIVEFKNKNTLIEDEVFFWNLSFIFDAIFWDRWNDNKKISDSILLVELLKFEESFKRTVEVIEFNFEMEWNKSFKEGILEENSPEFDSLLINFRAIHTDKIHYWNELSFCLEKANKIKYIINKKIEIIEEIILGNFDIDQYPYFSKQIDFKVDR